MEFKSLVYSMLLESNIDTKFADLTLSRLEGLGFVAQDHHVFTVGFAIIKSFLRVKNSCGITSVPSELTVAIVELSVADVLASLLSAGYLQDYFLGDGCVKSVSVGDTSVAFDCSSSASVDALVDSLVRFGEEELVCFRRIHW